MIFDGMWRRMNGIDGRVTRISRPTIAAGALAPSETLNSVGVISHRLRYGDEVHDTADESAGVGAGDLGSRLAEVEQEVAGHGADDDADAGDEERGQHPALPRVNTVRRFALNSRNGTPSGSRYWPTKPYAGDSCGMTLESWTAERRR